MKLIELIDNLDSLSDGQMIFIASNELVREDIQAITGLVQENVETGKTPTGMKYFLEVNLAKEVLEVWEMWRDGKKPTLHEKFQALVYYFDYDAYMPES
jgi:hypothetical protein